MNELAPVYEDERVHMTQYNRCDCGRLKSRQAKHCRKCFNFIQRKRDAAKQWRKGQDGSK